MNKDKINQLENLTEEEKKAVLDILNEYSNKGTSDIYQNLIYADYKEIPVDIDTFLHDPRYLGKGLVDDEGRFTVFPYWEKKLKELFPNNLDTTYNNVILTGSIGTGKEQPISSLVLTENGFMTMGEIKPGMKVYSRDGKLCNVLEVFPQGVKDVYEFTFSDNSKVRCGLNHLWQVKDYGSNGNIKVVDTKYLLSKSLKRGNQNRYSIPICNPIEFNLQEVFISPYMMGCLLGDGCFTSNPLITSKDTQILEYIEEELKSNNYCLYKTQPQNNKSFDYRIIKMNRSPLPNIYKEELKKLNLWGKKSNEKFIPKEYLYNDTPSRISLLQGLLDTDGEARKSKRRCDNTYNYNICFSTTSFQLKEDVIWLVRSLGGIAREKKKINRKYHYVYKGIDEYRKCKDYYAISIQLPSHIQPFKLKRKSELYNIRSHKEPSRYITSIKKLDYQEESKCILVDNPEHLYITDNFVVTHNTLFSVVCMLYMLYRMLCLKDPYKHYGLQPIDLITFSFMNITKDAAKGVGWNKCQQLLQSSSWFMERGQVTGSLEPEWHPVGGIELIYGSLPRHVIGRAVFCLDEDTSIVTTTENKTIKDLINNREPILTYNINTKDFEITTQYEVLPTGISNEEYQIELEDDTLIKCTPNHKFLLSTKNYKEAKDLSNEDVLFGITNIKIKTINKITLPQSKQYYDIIDSTPHHNFVIATNTGGVVSHNCSFEDEISFQPNQDLEKQKEKAKLLVSSIEARMKSRYMKGEKLPTLHLLASSKRTEQSFLETWIETKKKNESKTTLIVDEPQWVIRTDKDSPRKFVVAVGNKFLENEVLPLDVREEDLQIYRDKGYQLMYVPMGYYENFLDDLDIALTDIAGISTSNAMNYISGVRWSNVRNNEIKNPFTKEVLEVGNDPKDKTQYYDFFDFSQLPKNMLAKPLYVHLDMSISGDKTGIAGVWIKGKKPQKEGEPPSQELFYRVAFSVAIKAPKGRQISFEKNRQFIYWLREQGLNVKGVSSDSFQSADLGQTLNARGYNYSTISVDRVKDGKCEPYQVFKSAIYEERIEIYPTKLLTEEIIGLVRDSNGKIDHSPAGVNCLTGGTLISLVDGREVSIKELVNEYNEGKTNYVYSFNHDTNTIEPKLIEKAWCSGRNAKLVEVFLDNGTSVKCTPEHRFMLRDGSYEEACKLKEQAVIMSFCDNDNIIYADGIHKVVSVKALDYVEDVYDLTISKNHNFALSCGIFVHNSKDISDATCAAIYNASQHAEEYAYDYGEDLNLIEETNTQSLQTNALKNQMTVDFEQELQRVFNPIANNPVNSNIQQRNIEDEPITFISNDMIIW